MSKKLIHSFKIPTVNFEAKGILKLADLSLSTTEPPLDKKLLIEELGNIISEPLKFVYECHSQSFRRSVKMTLDAVNSAMSNLRHKKFY